MHFHLLTIIFFFFNDTATTEIYTYLHTLSLHDALPILECELGGHFLLRPQIRRGARNSMIIDNLDIFGIAAAKTKDQPPRAVDCHRPLSLSVAGQRMQPHRLKGRNIVQRLRRMQQLRSEEHTSELQSLMRSSYAVFCLKKKKNKH